MVDAVCKGLRAESGYKELWIFEVELKESLVVLGEITVDKSKYKKFHKFAFTL